jgi:hypothetical protein
MNDSKTTGMPISMRTEIEGNLQDMTDKKDGKMTTDPEIRILEIMASIRDGNKANIRDGIMGITMAGIDKKDQT